MGPGSKTFFNTNIIKSEKVQIERISSTTKTNGVLMNTFINEKMTNNMGIIEIRTACLFDVAKEKIPANRNSIQKIFNSIINEE